MTAPFLVWREFPSGLYLRLSYKNSLTAGVFPWYYFTDEKFAQFLCVFFGV